MTMQLRVPLPAPGESREFTLDDGQAKALEGFVIAAESGFYAYRNRCPHTGAPLNWLPNQFLNYENDMIQCALHGALFRIADGHCLHGPCLGESLESLSLRREGSHLVIEFKLMEKD